VPEVGTKPSRPGSTLLVFLIADVRGYTRFTHEQGDAAAARLADRFAGLCEGVLGAHDGRMIELRGDEALAIFSSARNALRGAVSLQNAFKDALADDPSLPLTVGMGLDAGEAIPVRGGYRGGALNLAARLCSIAGPGEILASDTAVGLARKTDGLAFVDRGQVSLKGLSAPVRVVQVATEGELPDTLPPLQPVLITHPTNLPDEPTKFIGREGEIAQIAALVRDPHSRLVTLTGPGGSGKTRLALQVGQSLLYTFRDGVFFCDLASTTDPTQVPGVIADVLDAKDDGRDDLVQSLIAALGERQLLLVLDNFEHVLEAADSARRVLDGCREVRILVTSRVPLHLRREHEHSVPPLSVPDPEHLPDFDALSQYESVALFVERARAARDTFAVTDENARAVAEICARLEGLPLAIELAAARVRLFPPPALLQRLSSRLKLLTGGSRDLPERQRTLRATIDWSYSLLNEEEKALFARLSVFVGGCFFEAAEAVCTVEEELDTLEIMASLVEKSLIRQAGEEEPRFTMLEAIREYADEKLSERSERGALQDAHASYFLQLAEVADAETRGPRQLEWFARLDAELPNLRAAIDHLYDGDRTEDGIRLICHLDDFWNRHYYVGVETVHRLEVGLQRAGDRLSPGARGRALFVLASQLYGIEFDKYGRSPESAGYLREALPLLEEAGDRFHQARSSILLGRAARFDENGEEARAWFKKALALYREIGEVRGMAFALGGLAEIAWLQEDDEEAVRLWKEALRLARQVGDVYGAAQHMWYLGTAALFRGDLEEAKRYLNEPRAVYAGTTIFSVGLPVAFGVLALKTGGVDIAGQLFREAMLVAREVAQPATLLFAVQQVVALELARGEPERAGTLLGAAMAWQKRLGTPMERGWREEYEGAVTRARAALDDANWQRLQDEGADMSLEEAIGYALRESV
jgi:predicted ATPase/class 3 adenylate cyclase